MKQPNRNQSEDRFRRYIEPLFKTLLVSAYRFTGSVDDAEDLVQEAFVKAYKNIDKLDENANPAGWVYTIMKNTFLNNLRSAKTREVLLFDDTSIERLADEKGKDNPPEGVDDDIQAIVNSLPEDMRLILVAREIQGLSYLEIAKSFDMPVGTVKSRLKRAREKLKEKWLRRKKYTDTTK